MKKPTINKVEKQRKRKTKVKIAVANSNFKFKNSPNIILLKRINKKKMFNHRYRIYL